MPFIGTQPDVGGYSVLDALTASATASYTLQLNSANFSPSSANQLLVSLNGVIQKPGSSFTVSGSTLTFSSALTSSDSIDFIIAMGEPLLVGTPSDATITGSKLASNIGISTTGNIATTGSGTLTSAGLITASAGVDVNGTEIILDADADTSITADTDDQIDIKIGGADSYHLKATAAHGNGIGIGTNAPLRQLHISNTSANSEIAFTAGTSGQSSLLFGDGLTGTDVYRGYVQYNHQNDTLILATSATSRLTIDDAGRFRVPNVYSSTTGSGANVNVASDGRMERSTSSRKYKNTIKDATHGLDDLLKLRSVTYKGNNDGDIVFGGLIAEEVHDAGLTEFVQYDDDNKPDALAYGNMVALCVKAIQELSAKNDALEAKVKALESK